MRYKKFVGYLAYFLAVIGLIIIILLAINISSPTHKKSQISQKHNQTSQVQNKKNSQIKREESKAANTSPKYLNNSGPGSFALWLFGFSLAIGYLSRWRYLKRKLYLKNNH